MLLCQFGWPPQSSRIFDSLLSKALPSLISVDWITVRDGFQSCPQKARLAKRSVDSKCICLTIIRSNFPIVVGPAIEVWAEQGLLTPDAWRSRRTNLSIKAKVEIPVSGTAIQIQQQALKFDQIPDSWPCDLESGWAAHYGRLDMKFMDMCQHLVQNQFVSDAFQGGPDSYLFQWDTNVWRRAGQWIRKVPGGNASVKLISLFRTLWHICEKRALPTTFLRAMKIQKLSAGFQCSMNSGPKGTWIMPTSGKEIQFLNCHPSLGTKSHSNSWRISSALHQGKDEFRMPFSPFMDLYSESDMSTAPPQQWLLYERRNQAAELRKQITGLMFELCQSFSGSDCDKIMDLLVTQCHGRLQQYVDDMQLMMHHTVAAAIQLDISPLTQRILGCKDTTTNSRMIGTAQKDISTILDDRLHQSRSKTSEGCTGAHLITKKWKWTQMSSWNASSTS